MQDVGPQGNRIKSLYRRYSPKSSATMSIPTQQKALIIPEQSAPFTLTRSFPVPEAGKDEVLVKIKAAALNPVDWMIQKSGIFVTHYPAVLGVDISGVIVQLGEGVKGRGMFKVGDKV